MKGIAIIEDERIIINGITAMLKRISGEYEVMGSAGDGIAGFDLLMNTKPDIVLCDIRIPGMDGLSLIETVKPVLKDTVFVIMSGYQEYEYAKKALDLGVIEYIEKPVTIPKLSALLHKIDRADSREQDDHEFEHKVNLILEKIRSNEYLNLVSNADQLMKLKKRESLEAYKRILFQFICVAAAVFYRENPYGKKLTPHLPSLGNMELLGSHEEVEAYVSAIMEDIARKMSHISQSHVHKGIEQVMEYIHKNYNRDIGLTELSELIHMNPSYLSVLFKEEAGMSFIKYLTHIRLNKAKELLLENYKNTEVCQMVGYQNYPYFCELFKRETGKTPGEFRSSERG